MYTFTGTLAPTPPFDFAKTLKFLGQFSPTRDEQRLDVGRLTKAVSIDGQAVVFELSSTGSLEAPALSYTLYSEQPLTEAIKDAATDRASFFLSLSDDLRPFYKLAASDPPFAPLAERLHGLHQVKFLTPFENAAWAILTQRNPIPVAHKVKERLTEQYGVSLTVNGATYRAFPEASRLLSVPPEELLAVIRNEQKVQYLTAVIAAFAGVDEQFLRQGPYEQVNAWLRNIRGIGEWSASFILIRALGRMETIIANNEPLRQAASKVYGRTFSEKDLRQHAQRYGEQQGYWAYYLRVGA